MSCILHPFFSVPTISLELQQNKDKPKSATNDHLVGHVILELKAPVDITQISVTLSGRSISRLDGTRHSQSHQASLFFFECRK